MGKQIQCPYCSKQHNSRALIKKCMRIQKDDNRSSQTRNQSTKELQADHDAEDLMIQIDKKYAEITEHRRQYKSFYNQYNRHGVSDELNYQSRVQKEILKQNKKSLKAIIQELIEVQNFTKNENKSRNPSKKQQISKQQKLNRYLRQNADRIQTFEQLVHRSIFNQWQWQQKQQMIASVDLSQSQARSRIRQFRGKDQQSIKVKYVTAWRILTDPLTRIMLSDQFLELWHEKTFPKFINPFKFKRLERQFKCEKKYHESQQKFTDNQQYQLLCQKFNELSKRLIQLKACPVPPSLSKSAEKLINAKEKVIKRIEQRIQEIEHDAESSQLIILPPQSQQKCLTYWQMEGIKREQAKLQRMRQKRSALEHKKWMKQMKKDRLTQNLMRYNELGFLMFAAQKGENLKDLVKLNYQDKRMDEMCNMKEIDIDDLELDPEQYSISALKKIQKQKWRRLHPKQPKQTVEEREAEKNDNNQLFKKMNQKKRNKLVKRTIK